MILALGLSSQHLRACCMLDRNVNKTLSPRPLAVGLPAHGQLSGLGDDLSFENEIGFSGTKLGQYTDYTERTEFHGFFLKFSVLIRVIRRRIRVQNRIYPPNPKGPEIFA